VDHHLASTDGLSTSLIDHESFLSFGIALTFFTLGVVGILGSDDIFCCFIVGNAFTWDDWFRVQTEDHAFQDVIDQLINSVQLLLTSPRMKGS
jgi:NhaP-type Na+/H+ or K+/H+ antiporter